MENDITVGLHIGGGVNLGKVGIDIRYETGLGSNFLEVTEVEGVRLDTRPNQFILGLSYKF